MADHLTLQPEGAFAFRHIPSHKRGIIESPSLKVFESRRNFLHAEFRFVWSDVTPLRDRNESSTYL